MGREGVSASVSVRGGLGVFWGEPRLLKGSFGSKDLNAGPFKDIFGVLAPRRMPPHGCGVLHPQMPLKGP